MTTRHKKSPQPIQALFRKLLPQEFRQKRAQIDHLQQFFAERKSDAVFQVVRVLNVTPQYLHVSLPNPALANYFRLHGQEIRQQIKQQFGQDLQLKISVQPPGNATDRSPSYAPLPHYSADVTEQIGRSADALEDDELKAALKSLSKTLHDKDSG